MDIFTDLSKDQLIMSAFGGVFVLISFVFIYFMASNIRKDIVSHHWPTTLGKIQDIEVVKHVREERKDTTRTYVSYAYERTYGYEVDGNSHTIKVSEAARNREDAVEQSKQHKLGETTSVYYDPSDPSESRTMLQSPWRNWIWFIGFLAFAGFGCGIIYIGFAFE